METGQGCGGRQTGVHAGISARAPEAAQDYAPAYVQNMRQWLSRLTPEQEARARKVISAIHPQMHELRVLIHEKKAELEAFSYDSSTTPETLPRIGHELQRLRRRLTILLTILDTRLREEVGVPLGPLSDAEYWFSTEDSESGLDAAYPGAREPSLH